MPKDGLLNMAFTRAVFLFCLTATGYATQYTPWFTPPFEVNARLSYFYRDIENFASDRGNFSFPTHHHTLHTSLAITPLPYWNVEGELLFTQTSQLSLGCEAFRATLRYQWFDDREGDSLSAVIGGTITFPRKEFLHHIDFLYTAQREMELHLTLGKELWLTPADPLRLWALGGYGIGNRGSPWFHSLGWIEYQHRCLTMGLFSEWYSGFGHSPLLPIHPFPGYGHIAYRRFDLGGEVCLETPYLCDLTFCSWYNLYARNCMLHDWGTQITLLFTFGIL
jgi:hypothetical protein